MTTAELHDHALYPRGGKCDKSDIILGSAVNIKSKTDGVCLNILLADCSTYWIM